MKVLLLGRVPDARRLPPLRSPSSSRSSPAAYAITPDRASNNTISETHGSDIRALARARSCRLSKLSAKWR
jgi:hypothetical protein